MVYLRIWWWRGHWQKLRAKWPPVGQNRYRELLRTLNHEREDHRREIEELSRSLDRVLPKLAQLSIEVQSTSDPNRFTLRLDMDPFLIREGFLHGDDDRMLRTFSERIGFMAYRELKTMNMHRFADSQFRLGHRLGRW